MLISKTFTAQIVGTRPGHPRVRELKYANERMESEYFCLTNFLSEKWDIIHR